MNYFKSQGPALISAGYRLVNVLGHTKKAFEENWPNKIITVEDCEKDNAADRSVGVLCGDIVCLDADIYDEGLSAKMLEVIKGLFPKEVIPIRRGAYPKFAMVFRNGGFSKYLNSVMYEKKEGDDEVTARIELLAKGKMFVAFGIHPDTGKEYQWEPLPLDFMAVSELPELTLEKWEEVNNAFDKEAGEYGYSAQHPSGSALAKVDTLLSPEELWLRNFSGKCGVTIEQFERELSKSIYNPADYKDWITVGQIAHIEFDGNPRAMDVWESWARQAPNYKSYDEHVRKWASFKDDKEHPVTYRTLLKNIPEGAIQNGFVTDARSLTYAVAEHLKGTLKYIGTSNRWMIYELGHWNKYSTNGPAHERVIHAIEYILNKKCVEYKGDPNLKKAIDALMKSFNTNLPALTDKVLTSLVRLGSLRATNEMFDSDRRYFGVGNGDIDLTTGEFLKPDPLRYVSRHSNICYVPEADCPRWKQTLRECLNDDDEMVDYFQRVVGQAALGQTNSGLMVFIYGGGCNGKSTVLEVLRAVFGDYQRTAHSDVFFGSSGGAIRSDLVDLRGARLIELTETERGGRFNTAQMKRITGGDEISARAPYSTEQERFAIVGVPFIATNYKPIINENDDGTWRRISLIGFDRNFENDKEIKKDEHLREKLALEYEGILNWVIEGALKVQKEGLKRPRKEREEVSEYRRESDLIGRFVEECLIVDGDKNKRMSRDKIYKLWEIFCQDNGGNGGIREQRDLTAELTRRYGWETYKSNSKRGYIGVAERPRNFSDTGED